MAAAERLMNEGVVAELSRLKRLDARARQKLAADRLSAFEIQANEKSYHLWLTLPAHWRSQTFVAAAARRDIALTPSTTFAVTPGHAPNAVRLALASPAMDQLDTGLVPWPPCSTPGKTTSIGLNERVNGSCRFFPLTGLSARGQGGRRIRPPDLPQAFLERESIDGSDRDRQQELDPAPQHAIGLIEGNGDFCLGSRSGLRIGNVPVRRCRMARPDRAGFVDCAVTHGEHEIHVRCAGPGELIQALGSQDCGVMAHVAQEVERVAIDGAERLASGTVGTEPALAEFVQDGLGQDRAGRVAVQRNRTLWTRSAVDGFLRDRRAVRVVSRCPSARWRLGLGCTPKI